MIVFSILGATIKRKKGGARKQAQLMLETAEFLQRTD